MVQLDPEQLKEVIINIIINACEAMGLGGSIVIHEKTLIERKRIRSVVIRISDNGPGIPDTIQSKIMEPFFTTKEEGTGLGLSIAARIVQDHGGRLDIESKEGSGSTFIITLPAEEPDRE
jgi:signal transduction histidine kinase